MVKNEIAEGPRWRCTGQTFADPSARRGGPTTEILVFRGISAYRGRKGFLLSRQRNDDLMPSRWWRRAAATMVYVNLTYRRLPRPAKAVLWLVPVVLARILGVTSLPWP